MNLSERARIILKNIDVHGVCIGPVCNERQLVIEEALLTLAREVREETIQKVITIVDNYPDITFDDAVRIKNEIYELLPTKAGEK